MLFDPDIFASALRIATPLILAAMGGLLCMRARIFNIALEGFMLVGAFCAIVFVDLTHGSAFMGLIGGLIAGLLVSAIYAVALIRFHADQIVAGIAINVLALGGTSFFLKTLFGISGAYRPETLHKLNAISIPILSKVPVLGPALSVHVPTVYFSLFLVVITFILLFKTPFGLAVRSVGEYPDAARTAGIRPWLIYTLVILWSGALSGLAGAHISTSIVSEFTEGMVQGRGFTAFTAIIFGAEHPVWSLIACLLFGFAESLGIRIEISGAGLPPSILKMFPYILAVLVLTVSSGMNMKRKMNSQ